MKKVVLITIGGTIASVSENPLSTTTYHTPPLTGEELLQLFGGREKLPGITVEVDDFMKKDSASLTPANWLELAKRTTRHLEKSDVSGVVITHGTDTMEESAYFLNLSVPSRKPVVFTGAMRPASAVSCDGGLNLYNALIAAASDKLTGCGVTICMNGSICSARDARKIHPTRPDAFTAVEMGAIGCVTDKVVEIYYHSSRRHTDKSEFDCRKIETLPDVRILYAYAGAPEDVFDHHLRAGAQGLVIAAVGNGNLSQSWAAKVKEYAPKLPVVRCTRANGTVNRNGSQCDDALKTIAGGNLPAQKARILLMFALAAKLDNDGIQRCFDKY